MAGGIPLRTVLPVCTVCGTGSSFHFTSNEIDRDIPMAADRITQNDNHETASIELRKLVEGMLNGHLREFSIELTESGMVLRGDCDSFHTKQMVQEMVAKHSSLPIISNELNVLG